MTETLITRIALPSDRLLDALEKASLGLVARLARGEPVVLVVGGAGEGDRVAGVVRDALSERGPGRPRALTDDDVLRAHDLVGAGLSIRDAADELGVSKSALGRVLQGYGAGRGPKRKLTDAQAAQVRRRHAAGESVQAIAADLAVSQATVRRALKPCAARKPVGQGRGQHTA
jgi:transposase